MPHLKLSKNMLLGQFFEKQTKIATHMDLWKYGQILIIQKSLTITSYIESQERIWNVNQYKCFHFVMFQSDDQFIFFNFKSPLLLTNVFFISK
jgi:hypothetical protein